jgi:rod shape-determining protein MreC
MKKNNLFTQIFVAVLILLIIASPLRKIFANSVRIVTRGTSAVLSNLGNKLANSFSGFREISSLKRENNELADKLTALQVDRSKIDELEYENELLRKELGFVQQTKTQELVPARIIEREPISFLDYVMVDKGSADGISKDMAVISSGVLVGQVGEVYENESRIILITSKDSIIQAMLQKSRSKGVLRGGISGLVLENITSDTEYLEGDYIITSGLGGELPEGILIGKAKGLQSGSSSILKNINVEPIADFGKLEIVFIIKKSQQS